MHIIIFMNEFNVEVNDKIYRRLNRETKEIYEMKGLNITWAGVPSTLEPLTMYFVNDRYIDEIMQNYSPHGLVAFHSSLIDVSKSSIFSGDFSEEKRQESVEEFKKTLTILHKEALENYLNHIKAMELNYNDRLKDMRKKDGKAYEPPYYPLDVIAEKKVINQIKMKLGKIEKLLKEGKYEDIELASYVPKESPWAQQIFTFSIPEEDDLGPYSMGFKDGDKIRYTSRMEF